MKTARVRKTEVGGLSCVFLDTNSRILQPVTVSGHLEALTVSNVGLQIWDEQVLQSARALTGRRSGQYFVIFYGNVASGNNFILEKVKLIFSSILSSKYVCLFPLFLCIS